MRRLILRRWKPHTDLWVRQTLRRGVNRPRTHPRRASVSTRPVRGLNLQVCIDYLEDVARRGPGEERD
jgi:hypothetical protein